MMTQRTGALIFDETADRYDIRFDVNDYYGGLHCGDCMEVFVRGKWKPTRIAFEDINYQLAQADDKTAIFENWCDFLNYFDASVSVQLSFINQGARKEKAQAAIEIPAQDDAF